MAIGTSGGLIAVLLSWCAYQLHADMATAVSLNLLAVVAVAVTGGFLAATLTSVAAATGINYFFIPPVLTFYIADTQSLVPLGTFEVVALIVSRLSAEGRRRAQTELKLRHQLEQLNALSSGALSLERYEAPGPQLAALIRRMLGVEAAVFDSLLGRADTGQPIGGRLAELVRETYFRDANHDDPERRLYARVLRKGERALGALVMRGEKLDARMVDAVASIVSIALERAKSFHDQSRAEAERQTEQVRAAVLDALAHAFKNPLTVIRTASTGLLEAGLSGPPATLAELIDRHATELAELTTRLLKTARLDGPHPELRSQPVDLGALVDDTLAQHRSSLRAHKVRFEPPEQVQTVPGDPQLLQVALAQLLDNAVKYSPVGSVIAITVIQEEHETVLSVSNSGSTVKPEEQRRIFERLYRGSEYRNEIPGTGLGLSIVDRILKAHGGRAWASGNEEHRATFCLAIPNQLQKPGTGEKENE